ncbi:MAG: hypothetical protein MdMp024_0024 [Bacteroidales bacterium]
MIAFIDMNDLKERITVEAPDNMLREALLRQQRGYLNDLLGRKLYELYLKMIEDGSIELPAKRRYYDLLYPIRDLLVSAVTADLVEMLWLRARQRGISRDDDSVAPSDVESFANRYRTDAANVAASLRNMIERFNWEVPEVGEDWEHIDLPSFPLPFLKINIY